MEILFLRLLNMSITASWLVLAVIIFRMCLKKAPKSFTVLMWVLVGIRLVCPSSFKSVFSLIPSVETFPQEILYVRSPEIRSGIPALNSAVNPIISESFSPQVGASANPLQIITFAVSVIWVIGMCGMGLYTVISYIKIYRKVRDAVPLKDNVWICDRVEIPFILGIIRPRIFLPSSMSESDAVHVIAHEKAHIKRGDHLWKLVGFMILTVYWFNPVIWGAYILLCRDIELACDEKVIRQMGIEDKKSYSEALINCSAPQKLISVCPLAFGEISIKSRIKSVLSYKKPTFWVLIIALAAGIVVAVCFLTDPDDEAYNDMSADGYYLTIGAENVSSIEVTTPNISGGCLYADGSPFKKGERVHLEWLDGVSDLQGVVINALNKNGEIMFALSVPEGQGNEINVIAGEEWLLAPSNMDVAETGGEQRLIVRKPLTLEDVTSLSKKGEALSWEDFEEFLYFETGSGLYIRQYDIDEMFTLFIGGTTTDEAPWYFYLHASDAWDEQIDIRTSDVGKFINEHKDNQIVKHISAGWQCSPVGVSEEIYSKIQIQSGMIENPALCRVRGELPVLIVTSKDELQYFTEEMDGFMELTKSYSDVPSFKEASALYDEEFFEGSTLLLVYISEPSRDHRHTVEYISKSQEVLSVGITVIEPESDDIEEEGWLISIGVPNKQIGDIAAVESFVSSVNYPDSGTTNAKMLCSYVFEESDEVIKPTVALFDNGKFIFTFSAFSSYVGTGDYTMIDDYLVLKTEDGEYTYVFDVYDNKLIFDADASSKQLWCSEIYDGAVLK